jgi:hypothetical protein
MTEPFRLKYHCLDFWRLLREARLAPADQRQARWFFFDQHLLTCPLCLAFFSVPQQYEAEHDDHI